MALRKSLKLLNSSIKKLLITIKAGCFKNSIKTTNFLYKQVKFINFKIKFCNFTTIHLIKNQHITSITLLKNNSKYKLKILEL